MGSAILPEGSMGRILLSAPSQSLLAPALVPPRCRVRHGGRALPIAAGAAVLDLLLPIFDAAGRRTREIGQEHSAGYEHPVARGIRRIRPACAVLWCRDLKS